jgi:hypothetical protein
LPEAIFGCTNSLRIYNAYQFKEGLGCRQSGANFSEIHPQPTVWLLVYIFGVLGIINIDETNLSLDGSCLLLAQMVAMVVGLSAPLQSSTVADLELCKTNQVSHHAA